MMGLTIFEIMIIKRDQIDCNKCMKKQFLLLNFYCVNYTVSLKVKFHSV